MRMEMQHNSIETKNGFNDAKSDNHRRTAIEMALAIGEELDDASLLKAVLMQHLCENKAQAVSRRLLARYRDLGGVLNCEMRKLLAIKDMTFATATALVRIRQLIKALSSAKVRHGTLFARHAEIREYCRAMLCRADREEFHALFFDRRGALIGESCLQKGTIDHVSVYPREVLRKVIEHDASYVILVHNHPFGKAVPSTADIEMTNELTRLVEMVGARIYDHIIVCPDDTFSLRENLRKN